MAKNISPWAELRSSLKNPKLSPKEKVKRLAGAKGLSLRDLSLLMRYNYTNLHNLLDGKRVYRVRQNQVAEILGVKVTDIWPDYKDAA